jgi:excisionase family DNA binding protein
VILWKLRAAREASQPAHKGCFGDRWLANLRSMDERALLDSKQWPSAPESVVQLVRNVPELTTLFDIPSVQWSSGVPSNAIYRGVWSNLGPSRAHGRPGLLKASAAPTVREAAVRIRVSPVTVYRLCAEGKLRHVRVSNALRIAEEDLEGYLRTSTPEKRRRSCRQRPPYILRSYNWACRSHRKFRTAPGQAFVGTGLEVEHRAGQRNLRRILHVRSVGRNHDDRVGLVRPRRDEDKRNSGEA